jgi:hypothetical protein
VVAAHRVALAPKAAGHPVFALEDIGHGPRLGGTDAYFSSVLRINAVLGSCVPRWGCPDKRQAKAGRNVTY